jgi:hypothetical protein
MSGTGTPGVQPSGVVNKVWAATGGSAIGRAVATLVVWYLDSNHILSPDALPTTVTSAISTLISTLAAIGSGYYVRPGREEVAVMDGSGRPVSAVGGRNLGTV